MHRFFIKEDIPAEGVFILNNEMIAHQLLRVLKIKDGEKVTFFNGSGFDYHMKVHKLSNRFISGRIAEKYKNERDPEIEIHLFTALIKKDNFGWVLEKATELGVKSFHPMLSERSVKTGINGERVRRIVTEATEQSGQDRIPEIAEVMKFKDALECAGDGDINILFDPLGAAAIPGRQKGRRINIFIGPEGGFTPKELERAKERTITIASLGTTVLRAETAAIVSIARILD